MLFTGLPILAVAIGVIAWSGDPAFLPFAILFPTLWAHAPSRTGAIIVSASYFLAASRGLPQGVATFYGAGFEAGIGLWLGAALAFVIVHGALWTAEPGWRRAARYGAAAVVMSIPPFGIVGWAQPITAAGILFPGWGWWGLAATAIGLLAMTTRPWPIAALVLGGQCLWSAATWMPANLPEGWIGVDTQFGGSQAEHAGYAQHVETIAIVKAAAADGNAVVVLPEGGAGTRTPTTERLWRKELANTDVVVNAGAIIVSADGYDNVMLRISGESAQVVYRERMPVPVSMWQPWRAWFGTPAGARAYVFDNPIIEFAGQRVAPLICYEQLLIWPILQSALHTPELIVATGNGWWTANTNIIAIQTAATEAWGKLFALPVAYAFNR